VQEIDEIYCTSAFSRCKVAVHIPSADRYLYLDQLLKAAGNPSLWIISYKRNWLIFAPIRWSNARTNDDVG